MTEPIRLHAKPEPIRPEEDGLRWLALLIRQGLKLIVTGIEHRYGLSDSKSGPNLVK